MALSCHRATAAVGATDVLQRYRLLNVGAPRVYKKGVDSPVCKGCGLDLVGRGRSECLVHAPSHGSFCAGCDSIELECPESCDPDFDAVFGTEVRVTETASKAAKYLAAMAVASRQAEAVAREWQAFFGQLPSAVGPSLEWVPDARVLMAHIHMAMVKDVGEHMWRCPQRCPACGTGEPCAFKGMPAHKLWDWTRDASKGNSLSPAHRESLVTSARLYSAAIRSLESMADSAQDAMLES